MQASQIGSDFQASGLAVPRRQAFQSRAEKRKTVHWPVALFLIALVVPWMFYFGPLRMSVYRIVLLLMILPCLAMWLTGKAGRVRIADIALLLYLFWATLSLMINHGLETSLQTTGIIFIETLGPYMLARCYIRDADDFYNAVQILFRIVVCLLPFAAIELFSTKNISRDLFQLVLPTVTTDLPPMPPRSGLTRVTAVFDHPILFGAFSGSILALVYLVLGYGKSFFQRVSMIGIVGITSLMSLSSGPLVGLATQGFLLCWNGSLSTFRFRWKLLIVLAGSMSLAVELIANRSLLDIFVGYFLFDDGSYWFRKLIWMYGTESVRNHPVFGTGLSDWARPAWMGASVDNFWLFHAMRHGLPAAFLMPLAFFSIFLAVSFKKGLDARLTAYRTGFLITMTSFFVIAWTVHFWDATYVLFQFLMGSGVWMLDVKLRHGPAVEAQRV